MSKCNCYHIQTERRHTYHITGEPIYYDEEVGVCWGTKEREKCSCCGNEAKCDFYPKVRERAENAPPNTWVITESGCVITCPKCGERLELCYPDGTEVRYLPHCPWCGVRLNKGE